jgi:hypothetical protein
MFRLCRQIDAVAAVVLIDINTTVHSYEVFLKLQYIHLLQHQVSKSKILSENVTDSHLLIIDKYPLGHKKLPITNYGTTMQSTNYLPPIRLLPLL